MAKTGFVYHPLYIQHETGFNHPESPLRVLAVRKAVWESDLRQALVHLEPSSLAPVTDRWIKEVHTEGLFNRIKEAIPREGQVHLDPDTVVGPFSFFAAQTAVSGVLMAADRVVSGELTNSFCAVRPPGHHAETDRAMGFCLFNNVAIAARYLQKNHGLPRVLVIDWDVHHGNGTQEIFYRDPNVFYFSVHQYPFYPGTGSADEIGEGDGEGTTLNCPFPSGAGDTEYIDAFERLLVPAAEKFRPDFILISAGFDAHRDDPLAGMKLTEDGFERMTRIVRGLAKSLCGDRVVSALEGGYNLGALGKSVRRHLEVLLE
jgi:acetoin utilization deacetylase AcuC-like enzyme